MAAIAIVYTHSLFRDILMSNLAEEEIVAALDRRRTPRQALIERIREAGAEMILVEPPSEGETDAWRVAFEASSFARVVLLDMERGTVSELMTRISAIETAEDLREFLSER